MKYVEDLKHPVSIAYVVGLLGCWFALEAHTYIYVGVLLVDCCVCSLVGWWHSGVL